MRTQIFFFLKHDFMLRLFYFALKKVIFIHLIFFLFSSLVNAASMKRTTSTPLSYLFVVLVINALYAIYIFIYYIKRRDSSSVNYIYSRVNFFFIRCSTCSERLCQTYSGIPAQVSCDLREGASFCSKARSR